MTALWFQFLIKQTSSLQEASKELSLHQVQDLSSYIDLEKNTQFLYGQGQLSLFPSTWEHIQSAQTIQVNWEEQWRLFCPYFQGDFCKIPLSLFSQESKQELLLSPGPGFGDLSHPTTHLVLSLLPQYIKDKVVLDLGCGSGILGLAALLLGAKYCYSLDIDPEAIAHTKKNARQNNLQDLLSASREQTNFMTSPEVLLLNMTFAEQKLALSSLPQDLLSSLTWITSGILSSQKQKYQDFLSSFPLSLLAIKEQEGWCSFVLEPK